MLVWLHVTMLKGATWCVTKRDREVVEITRSCVQKKYKIINFMKLIRIERYNRKYGSNPQGIREILDDLFEFDQIRR